MNNIFSENLLLNLVYLFSFSETFRLYHVIPQLTRICTEKCTLGSLEVETGTVVIIPTYSLHRDPKYFPNPEHFNPENFSEENKNRRHKFVSYSFGYGPRKCPGKCINS